MTICNFAQLGWNDLRVFYAFARAESISGAAKLLAIDHSTVSRRLIELERQTAVMLIRRTNNGYQLTADGHQLATLVFDMAESAEHILCWANQKKENLSGTLTISCCDISLQRLSTLIGQFQVQHPTASFSINTSPDHAELKAPTIDLVIRATLRPDENLIGHCLQTYQVQLARSSAIDSFSGLPWIGLDKSFQRLPCERWQGSEKKSCRSTITADSYLTISQLIRAGNGIGLLPDYIIEADPGLIRIATDQPLPNGALWLLYHQDLRKNKLVTTFGQFLKAHW